jgi:menaquinone-specific isochorismate synthase
LELGVSTLISDQFFDSGTLISTGHGTCLIGWGQRHWVKDICRIPHPVFYFPDFFLKDSKPWFWHEHYCEIGHLELAAVLSPISDSRSSFSWQPPEWQVFEHSVNELKDLFKKQLLLKAVPYVFEKSDQKLDQLQLCTSLKCALDFANRHPVHLYGFWDHTEGILGATPEILFRMHNIPSPVLETVACAGTSSSGQASEILAHDPKELYEHQLVVDGIVSALSPFGLVEIGKRTLLPLSRIVHLSTPLVVKLHRMTEFTRIVHAMHPTAALGAIPENEGWKWLKNYQKKIPRRRHGAPAGYAFPEQGRSGCLVAIRNMQWHKNQIWIVAGCGIVPESQLEREREEIQLKIRSIKELLAL